MKWLQRLPRLGVARAVCLVLGALLLAQPAIAQEELGTTTRTYLIQNARVVQAPGQVLESGDVLVRDGRIVRVGRSVAAPFDAEIIAGDSLVVYAGFIDGLSNVGIPKPKPEENRERVIPGNPPDARAGIQPQVEARELLDAGDKSIEDLRKAGFTIAHTVPHGQMMPGKGAIVLLAGDDPYNMVLRGNASLYATFAGAQGVYPSTPMAILSKWRDLYNNAARHRALEARYESGPAGVERPAFDPEYYALFPVVANELPVMFKVEDSKEAQRVLRLSDELGFDVMLAGLEESWFLHDELDARNTPVFLTLELPEEPKLKKDEVIDTTLVRPRLPRNTFFPNPNRTFTYRDKGAERDALVARQAEQRVQYYRNAAALDKAGIAFGFSTMDAKPGDVLKNVRTMIANGLSEDAALAALTSDAAALLGLGGVAGTVEEGKLGNLVVMTGPLADDDSQIKMVFVDGHKFEYDVKEKKAAASGDAADGEVTVVGSWAYTIESPQGTLDGTVEISGTPGSLTGVITSSMAPDEIDLDDVMLEGTTLSFSFVQPGLDATIEFSGEISGDTLSGMVSVPGMGSFPLEATRTPGS